MDRVVGPFELCHCSRCRKVSGSAFMAGVGVRRDEFRFVSGRNLVTKYDAPILESPPAYRVCFCSECGCCVPDPEGDSEWLEIAAGLLDDDPGIRPDKHIFVERKANWFEITDGLPQLDKQALLRHRRQLALKHHE
ncbi:MAG TPA: GFA family protein [Candidatus Binatia bacterium]|nr:GFA family protein [Candidatus Binatia bacterium]